MEHLIVSDEQIQNDSLVYLRLPVWLRFSFLNWWCHTQERRGAVGKSVWLVIGQVWVQETVPSLLSTGWSGNGFERGFTIKIK